MSMNHLAQVTRAYQNSKVRLSLAEDNFMSGLLTMDDLTNAQLEVASLRTLLATAKIEAGVEDEKETD